jgi:hypothetical protein
MIACRGMIDLNVILILELCKIVIIVTVRGGNEKSIRLGYLGDVEPAPLTLYSRFFSELLLLLLLPDVNT